MEFQRRVGAAIMCAVLIAGCSDGGGSSNVDSDAPPAVVVADRYGYDLDSALLAPLPVRATPPAGRAPTYPLR